MNPRWPDAALLAAVADGRSNAFDPFVARHLRAVHGYVARRIGGADAEDIVSETFEVAFRKAGSYRALGDDARPWLLGIATNLLRRSAKREAAMYRAYARTGVDPVHTSGPERPAHDHDAHRALAGALADMKREHREVLVLHALGELSYEEIARAMDVPLGTVKGWLHRARETAAKAVTDAGLAPDHLSTEVR